MPDKEAVRTEAAPATFQGAPYSQAVRAGGLVFVSGQLALRPGLPEIVGDVPPARATLEVSALPSGALVEIDAIALA